jgi:hypothetical protein
MHYLERENSEQGAESRKIPIPGLGIVRKSAGEVNCSGQGKKDSRLSAKVAIFLQLVSFALFDASLIATRRAVG